MTTADIAIKPWYRQFWPWFLMSLPAASVVAGIITVVIATDNRDHVVVDDYYKKGLAINRVIGQQELAAKLGLVANVKYAAATGELVLMLNSESAPAMDSLSLSLVHATRADYDRHALLHKDRQGSYKTNIKDIQTGRWNMILEPADKQWRLDAQVVFPATQWVLKPNV